MKKFTALFLSIMMLVLACRKDPVVPPKPNPGPTDTATIRSFRFVFDSLPGQSGGAQNLAVFVTITNDRNQTVLDNKKYALQYDGKYLTPVIELVKGNYKINAMLIRQDDTLVRFAAPIRGSVKATLVNNPLSVSFKLDEKIEKAIKVDILPVAKRDRAEQYGYPAGSFGTIPPDPDPTPQDIFIFIHPIIKVGDIVYDSIPVTLNIRSFDINNIETFKYFALHAGIQQIMLPANGVRYQLTVDKWGAHGEITLLRNQVQANAVYPIEGSINAKKLQYVYTSKIINGVSRPETKAAYEYFPDGSVKQILNYAKHADLTTYLASKEEFEYQNNRVSKVKVTDEANSQISVTDFRYNSLGKVSWMEEVKGTIKTTANVSYMDNDGGTDISKDHQVNIAYTYSDHYYTMNLNKVVHGGVVISDVAATSHGNLETGLYGHDFGINPYIMLGVPDLNFSNYSKHNVLEQWKTYVNAFPIVYPYSFSYTYNANGYPTELRTKYKTYLTQEEAYTIRTVYTYF